MLTRSRAWGHWLIAASARPLRGCGQRVTRHHGCVQREWKHEARSHARLTRAPPTDSRRRHPRACWRRPPGRPTHATGNTALDKRRQRQPDAVLCSAPATDARAKGTRGCHPCALGLAHAPCFEKLKRQALADACARTGMFVHNHALPHSCHGACPTALPVAFTRARARARSWQVLAATSLVLALLLCVVGPALGAGAFSLGTSCHVHGANKHGSPARLCCTGRRACRKRQPNHRARRLGLRLPPCCLFSSLSNCLLHVQFTRWDCARAHSWRDNAHNFT